METNFTAREKTVVAPATMVAPANDSWVDAAARRFNFASPDHTESAFLHPCVINGKSALVYERGLEVKKPNLFEYLVKFARARPGEAELMRFFGSAGGLHSALRRSMRCCSRISRMFKTARCPPIFTGSAARGDTCSR